MDQRCKRRKYGNAIGYGGAFLKVGIKVVYGRKEAFGQSEVE